VFGRLVRLGIPFAIGLFAIIPAAFYPTMLKIKLVYGIGQGFGSFWLNFVKAGLHPPGPLWFIWLLLAFDLVAALVYGMMHRFGGRRGSGRSPLLETA
jgi:hypothetical protein